MNKNKYFCLFSLSEERSDTNTITSFAELNLGTSEIKQQKRRDLYLLAVTQLHPRILFSCVTSTKIPVIQMQIYGYIFSEGNSHVRQNVQSHLLLKFLYIFYVNLYC